MTFRIIWEFRPAPGKVAAFELAYGPDGLWADLFRRGAGYVGTELIRPAGAGGWYRTIDEWESEDDYEAFLEAFAEEYEALDADCAMLTADEQFILSEDT